jgi:glycosyltransferase involved in cell wall biosynthesis
MNILFFIPPLSFVHGGAIVFLEKLLEQQSPFFTKNKVTIACELTDQNQLHALSQSGKKFLVKSYQYSLGRNTLGKALFPFFAGNIVKCLRENADIVYYHFTYIPISPFSERSVSLIHDMQVVDLPENFSFFQRTYRIQQLKRTIRNADAIIVPSQFTKERVRNFIVQNRLDRKETPIHVIPEASQFESVTVSSENEKRIIQDFFNKNGILKRNYYLFPASYWPHKNHKLVIDAVSLMKSPLSGTIVCCGGMEQNRKKLEEYAQKKGVRQSFVFAGHVSRETLFIVYKNARALLFPSQYEGFGIPISEAVQFNLPIVGSDIPTTREIVGENAQYFGVRDTIQLAQILEDGIQKKQQDKKKTTLLSWKKTLNGFERAFQQELNKKTAKKREEILKQRS